MQKELTAWGFASGINDISLARSTAENRARAALLELSNGLSFEMNAIDEHHATLSLRVSGTLQMSSTRFYGWNGSVASTATVARSDEEVARLGTLSLVEVSADANDDDPGCGLLHAKRRALRMLILGASSQRRGSLAGHVTIAASEVVFAGKLITVKLLAHVQLSKEAPFDQTTITSVALAIAKEQVEGGHLEDAVQTIELALCRRPTDLELLRQLLLIQQTRNDERATADVQQQIADIETFAAEQKKAEAQALSESAPPASAPVAQPLVPQPSIEQPLSAQTPGEFAFASTRKLLAIERPPSPRKVSRK